MKRARILAASIAALSAATMAFAADQPQTTPKPDNYSGKFFKSEESVTGGSVNGIAYQATAGTLVVHPKGWNDSAQNGGDKNPDAKGDESSAEASMFFVYYAKRGVPAASRPITFLYNGGPGSATVWLHMGAFGPRRIVTSTDSHTPAAPYSLVNNASSLLDVSDLVFIDAPGTGFGHLRGTDKEKAFYGVDQDAHAFANFIVEFLSRHNRWNSPKYLFGESYGTTRSAALASILQSEKNLDLNGIVLLSQILNFDDSVDQPQFNPGVDLPYVLVLPTYAATAWYHHKLPNQPPALEPLLREVENFAMTDYMQALAAGSTLSAERKAAIAARLHNYTGLPADYIERANLRVNGGEFAKSLLGSDITTGRLDTRFAGPTIDPMSKEAGYDPQSAAISSAYVSAFNEYVRSTLKFGDKKTFK